MNEQSQQANQQILKDPPFYTHQDFFSKELRYTGDPKCGTPLTKCDLVMKGGIASGIVYPPAVVKMATQYRFSSIGGASAGAIAAAATAAAELGRQRLMKAAIECDSIDEEILLRAMHELPNGQLTSQQQRLIDELRGNVGFVGLHKFSVQLRGKPGNPLIFQLFANSAPYATLPLLNLMQDAVEPSWYKQLTGSIRWLDNWLAMRRQRDSPDDALPLVNQILLWLLRGVLLPLRVLLFLIRSALGVSIVLIELARRDWMFFSITAVLSFLLTTTRGVEITAVLSQLAGFFGLAVAVIVSSQPALWVQLLPHVVVALAVGALASVLHLLWVILKTVPNKTHFGLCTGLSRHLQQRNRLAQAQAWVRQHIRLDHVNEPGLTDWLAAWFNQLAGKLHDDPPVTCADLKAAGVTFQAVTTNLSQRRPYTLPFDNQGIERFIFNEQELLRFFPSNIVKYMISRSNVAHDQMHPPRDLMEGSDFTLPTGYYFMPEHDDLPVAVAMRMSLSLPGVISAVPFYTLSRKALKQIYEKQKQKAISAVATQDLQLNLFSDGGIASNFPIHFFDRWLPNSPTFAISTVTLDEQLFTQSGSLIEEANDDYTCASVERLEAENIGATKHLPSVELGSATKPTAVEWSDITGVPGFIGAIIDTMMNYRDNLQAALPSYRERVVRVRLNPNEGGLNLKMTPATVAQVQAKGFEAGVKLFPHVPESLLQHHPNQVGEFDFDQHWWVRFRLLMCELETHLLEVAQDDFDRQEISGRLTRAFQSKQLAFPLALDDEVASQERVQALLELIQQWQKLNLQYAEKHAATGVQGSKRFFEPPGILDNDASLRVTPNL